MIKIYTDASINNEECVATCFSTTDTMFICYTSFSYSNIKSSLHGELLGIRDGIAYTIKHSSVNEPISVFSDSVAAVKLIKSGSFSKRTISLKPIVEDIYSLCQAHDITIDVIQGHQLSHNPNKIVDLTSNSILRFNRR